eukprot:jgi/Mesvir1/26826/Mv20584-RA.1
MGAKKDCGQLKYNALYRRYKAGLCPDMTEEEYRARVALVRPKRVRRERTAGDKALVPGRAALSQGVALPPGVAMGQLLTPAERGAGFVGGLVPGTGPVVDLGEPFVMPAMDPPATKKREPKTRVPKERGPPKARKIKGCDEVALSTLRARWKRGLCPDYTIEMARAAGKTAFALNKRKALNQCTRQQPVKVFRRGRGEDLDYAYSSDEEQEADMGAGLAASGVITPSPVPLSLQPVKSVVGAVEGAGGSGLKNCHELRGKELRRAWKGDRCKGDYTREDYLAAMKRSGALKRAPSKEGLKSLRQQAREWTRKKQVSQKFKDYYKIYYDEDGPYLEKYFEAKPSNFNDGEWSWVQLQQRKFRKLVEAIKKDRKRKEAALARIQVPAGVKTKPWKGVKQYVKNPANYEDKVEVVEDAIFG